MKDVATSPKWLNDSQLNYLYQSKRVSIEANYTNMVKFNSAQD